MNTATPDHRILSLDGVRGFALLAVLLHHGVNATVIVAPPTRLDYVYLHTACLGWIGLDLFFVLSGYLITGILVNSRGSEGYFFNFYARRTLRIFPLYYLIICLLLFVLPRPPAAPGLAVAHLLYYQNIFYALHPETYNDVAKGVTWSLAIEEQFYLLWPAVVAFTSRRNLIVVCWSLIVTAVVLRFWLSSYDFKTLTILTPCRMDAIALGALLAITKPLPAVVWRVLCITSLVAFLELARRFGPQIELPHMRSYGLSIVAVFATSVVALSLRGGLCCRIFSNKILRALGLYSYAVYLVHLLVYEQLINHLFGPIGTVGPLLAMLEWTNSNIVCALVFYVMGTAISFAIAYASWHLFEKRLVALKRYFPARRGPSAPSNLPAG